MGVSGGRAESARPATSVTSSVGKEMLAPRHLRQNTAAEGVFFQMLEAGISACERPIVTPV